MVKILKIKKLIAAINKSLDSGDYIYTGHANARLQQREVTRQEVKQVLRSGFHEKKKDKYDPAYESWNYSVKGTTIDNRNLRVIVSFDEYGMLIITVIDINK
ncbi:MAG: DUF4258 domain-containing protein [Bacteriovoracaceae bacterium]|nr:DUF4258 domain-containing protein [Bacteriovoracaceae bacterium]